MKDKKYLITTTILALGLISSIFWSYLQYSKLEGQQVILKGEWDYTKTKVGEFEKIIISNSSLNCTGNQTLAFTISNGTLEQTCYERKK